MQVAEAEAAVELVRFIKTYGKHPDGSPFEIGIITPFRAQIAYIKHLLCEAELEDDILVDTVERYQGQQRDIIIYSLATNDNQSMLTIQALNQEGTTDRKLLVSLSRAKEQIIILGNRELAQTSQAYAQVINHLDSCNAYFNQAITRNLFLEVDAYLQNKTT
jgi:DNA replication ATP-dependent helicase Dna2